MDGEIALAFGDLLRKLWALGASPVAPRMFKTKLARFAPQFSGYNQHDSQELLAFLLDGLHEDLNRVKCKPYVEAKDFEGRPDEEVADEYWNYHLARNNSIIVDTCQEQYKSTLVCPVCKIFYVTLDPFMYLSLPLPSTSIRTLTVTVISIDGSAQPSSYTVSVPTFGKCEDLVRVLSVACSLGPNATLLVGEIYNNRIIYYLEEPTDSLTLIRDWLLISWSSTANLGDVHETKGASPAEDTADTDTRKPTLNSLDVMEVESPSNSELQFYLTDEKGPYKKSKIEMNEPVAPPGNSNLYVAVCWPESQIKECDMNILCSLPEIFKSGILEKRAQESVSSYKCLEAFLTEEPLGPEDVVLSWLLGTSPSWQKIESLETAWDFRDSLFSYSRFMKNKLETFVDFPISDLDLSAYVIHTNAERTNRYMIYAMSKHHGSMGGGHCTAFVHHGGDRWYDFDDSHICPISLDKIKTSAAYVLFYRRVIEA